MKTASQQLPVRGGIGLKAQHYQQILETTPDIGWLEVHPENYMGAGGPPHRYLQAIREHYPLSMHGVGMSLGSASGIDPDHLRNLAALIARYQPEQVSEHIAWSHWNDIYLNDLLPLPYTQETLTTICDNLDRVQTALGRTILIENPSTYIDFLQTDFSEPDFLNQIGKITGAGLLLDVNNIYVSAMNNDFDPYWYVDNINLNNVEEVHLAGHAIQALAHNISIRIDDHASAVTPDVWKLYEHLITNANRGFATLIEWDNDIPTLETLMNEAQKAELIMAAIR